MAYMEEGAGNLTGHTLWSLKYAQVMRKMVMGPNRHWIGTVDREETFTTSGDIASGWNDDAMAVYNYVQCSGVGLWGTVRVSRASSNRWRLLANCLNAEQANAMWDITAAYRTQVHRVREVVRGLFEPLPEHVVEAQRDQRISVAELDEDDDWWNAIGAGVGIGEEYEEVVAAPEAAYQRPHDWRYNPDTGALITMEEWIWLGYGLGDGDCAAGSTHQGTAYQRRRPE